MGHQRRPHQSRDISESTSGSASSQGVVPDQISEGACVQTVDSTSADSDQDCTLVIPKIMIEDALARLRGLRDDAERMRVLEQYGQLKFRLASKLWKGGIPPSRPGA